jgi:hypothetical protein
MTQPHIGNPAPETTPKPLGLLVALISGRIVRKARRYKSQDGTQRYATLVKLPNPDEYTNAGTVEVQSAEPLGDPGDQWRGKVRISGSVKSFSYTDRVSGEVKSGEDVSIRLSVVE